jgi:Lon-like ATP-dependent protease
MTNEWDWDSWIIRKKPEPEIKSVPTVTSVTEVTKDWDWNNWTTTEGFPVSTELMDWVIGQDRAIEETKLCIDEWINKLSWLKKKEWWKDFEDPKAQKPQPKDWLPVGPYLLLLGDAGTGKSLLGRAMSSYMTKLYKEKGLKLYDVLSWRNPTLPSEPKISIHPSGTGKSVIFNSTLKNKKKSFFSRWGMKLFVGFMVGMGMLILGLGFYFTSLLMQEGIPFQYALSPYIQYMVAGGGLMFSGIFIRFFSRVMGNMGSGTQGIGGATSSNCPKLLIDNSSEKTPFIDATGHGSAQLFGSIAWDPYQTGGLGTPEHQRVTAGDVHRAHLGILYIDELKNLTGQEAITLLTVLEDAQLPIALRSLVHGGDTAAMSVSTEPIPSMVFFIGAGNLDSLQHIHQALLDRIQGYGKVVYMNNDMSNTEENRRKVIQFIAQEIKRFNLLPFDREACEEIIAEFRRKSGFKNKLTTKFRPMISIIKTASTLTMNEGLSIVKKKHVDEAVKVHCKNIGMQILERQVEKQKLYNVITPSSKPKKGQIFGLAVLTSDNEDVMVGSVLPIRASMIKCELVKLGELVTQEEGYFHVTGVETVNLNSWVQHSISKVVHVFAQKYKINLSKYKTHIDFAQSIGIDGPSAGVTMALALISIYKNKKIRQDVAVTGEINIGIDGKVEITPIGGVHEKIMAAQEIGIKKVLIPKRNYEVNINPADYTIEVVGCETLEDYMREILV